MKKSATATNTRSPAAADPVPSDRLMRLHARFQAQYAAATGPGRRCFVDPEEVAARDLAYLTAYRATRGEPAISRRARLLEQFAESARIGLTPDDLLAGSQKFCAFSFPEAVGRELNELGYANNAGHIVHDYARLLRLGVGGLLGQLDRRRQTATTADEQRNLDAFGRAMAAFRRFIFRHAEAAAALAATLTGEAASEWRERAQDLQALTATPPAHFRQALQLTWFMQLFLHAENPAAAISFGRLDQYLWPFLERDLAEGAITWAAASDLAGAFCLRCCEGDESQNLAVGGVDEQGRDVTNPLSILLLDLVRVLRAFQPSLVVRLHPQSPPALTDAAGRLAAIGIGQPGFINDPAVIPGLLELGIPLPRARDYAIVGCYEATTQGDCYPNTVCGHLHLTEALVRYLATPAAQETTGFEAFLRGWYDELNRTYQAMLTRQAQPAWNHWRDRAPSPFGSMVMAGCLDRALPVEAGGAPFNLFGINILGLGTAVDSLHALREAVFVRHELTTAQIATAVAGNFPDEALRQKLRNQPGRFGTDSEGTNALAHEVSTTIALMVLASRLENGVRPYPGFFCFTADIWEHNHATPDGRRREENLSYGAGPASAAPTTPTSVLASMRHVAHALCACGNPLALSLPATAVAGAAGIDRLTGLVKTYFAQGGLHLHFNLHSAQDLRAAKATPDQHADLTIRISGLSARFVTLPEPIQDALIERAETGV